MSEGCLSFGLLGFLLAWPCGCGGGEGWTLHPQLDQEEEAREGKVCSDAKKTNFRRFLLLVEQWEWCVRTMAAAMETWASQSGVEISVENKDEYLGKACSPSMQDQTSLGSSH